MATTTANYSSHTGTVTIYGSQYLVATTHYITITLTDGTVITATAHAATTTSTDTNSPTFKLEGSDSWATADNLATCLDANSKLTATSRADGGVPGVVTISHVHAGGTATTIVLTDPDGEGMSKTDFTGGPTEGLLRNNGATVISGGNVDGSAVSNSKALMDNLDSGPSYGSKVVAITGTKFKPGVQTSKGSGALAYQPSASDPQFLLRSYSSKINNVASTALQIPGADSGGRANKAGVVKTHRYDVTSIAYATGFATKGGNAGDASNFVQSDGSTAATDDALQTTRAIPGELVFHIGANSPTQADYSAKTGG